MGMYLAVYTTEDPDTLRDPGACRAYLEEAEMEVDVGKAWDLIGRVVLNGSPAGLFDFGSPINDVDMGYGPPIGIGGSELDRLAEVLAALDVEGAIADLDEGYPYHSGITDADRPEITEWITPLLAELATAVKAARTRSATLVLVLG